MANLNADEMEMVKAAQDALGTAKKALNDVEASMRRLSKINREAGRLVPANAAMRLQGAAASARGAIIQAHADASDALAAAYDDGGVVILGGGGGR
jgi:hypothetical protein